MNIPDLVQYHDEGVASFWMEITTDDVRKATVRAKAGRLLCLGDPSNPPVVLLRVPIYVEPGLVEAGPVASLFCRGLRGLTQMTTCPVRLNELPLGDRKFRDAGGSESLTIPLTDARPVETALLETPHSPIRDLIQLYLHSISVAQDALGLPEGNGEQTRRFIQNYWHIGDVGVGEKFVELTPPQNPRKLAGRTDATRHNPTPRTRLKTRLRELERRLERL